MLGGAAFGSAVVSGDGARRHLVVVTPDIAYTHDGPDEPPPTAVTFRATGTGAGRFALECIGGSCAAGAGGGAAKAHCDDATPPTCTATEPALVASAVYMFAPERPTRA